MFQISNHFIFRTFHNSNFELTRDEYVLSHVPPRQRVRVFGRRVIVSRVGGERGRGAPRVSAARPPPARRGRARRALRPHARHVLVCNMVHVLCYIEFTF